MTEPTQLDISPASPEATGGSTEIIRTLHRSILSLFGGVILFVALTIIVCVLSYKLITPDSSSSLSYLIRALALLPALVLLETLRRYFNDLWILRTDAIEHHKGRIALSYSVPLIDYADIREVMTSQKIYERVLGYGDVYIGTSAQEGWEMVIRGIANPAHIQRLIEDLRRRREEEKNLTPSKQGND